MRDVKARQMRTCFQGTHHLARGVMKVHGLLECQLKSRHWQSDMDFGEKERILMAWEKEMQGMKGKLSRDWYLSLKGGY